MPDAATDNSICHQSWFRCPIPVYKISHWTLLFLILSIPCCLPDSDKSNHYQGTASNSFDNMSVLDTEWNVGNWIWSDTVYDKQFCRFWRVIEIPNSAAVLKAQLRITADNGFKILLDGRELGQGSDWRSLTEFDISRLLRPGKHVIAIEAFNDRLYAGVILGLKIEFNNGVIWEIPSDTNWFIVPLTEKKWETRKHPASNWKRATVVGKLGESPWNIKPLAITKIPPIELIQTRFWQTWWFQLILLSFLIVSVLVCLMLLWQLSVQSNLQSLLQRERERIAKDIHDEIGIMLTRLILEAEVIKSTITDVNLLKKLNSICNQGREIHYVFDEVVWVINSKRDTLRDFITYVCKFTQNFFQNTGISCRLQVNIPLEPEPFDLPLRRNLFMAIKEAINNVLKHSRANEITLTITRKGEGLTVSIHDNGIGFDPLKVSNPGNGIKNMNDRMNEIGGKFNISSTPSNGCLIEFYLPSLQTSSKNKIKAFINRCIGKKFKNC